MGRFRAYRVPWAFIVPHTGIGLVFLLCAPHRFTGTIWRYPYRAGAYLSPSRPMTVWGILFLLIGLGFLAGTWIDRPRPLRACLVVGAFFTVTLAVLFAVTKTSGAPVGAVLAVTVALIHIRAVFYDRLDPALIWPRRDALQE